jgi:hypothetical protein
MTANRFSIDPPLASAGSWPSNKPPAVAYDEARAAVRAQAGCISNITIKSRARDYLAEPWQLDLLGARPGFIASAFTPQQIIEFAKELLRQEFDVCERMAPRRIELVPVKKWNAKAAIIAGRWRRNNLGLLMRAASKFRREEGWSE